MKSLFSVALFVLTLTFGANAHAENCTALLKNSNGYTLDTFNAYGYNRVQACNQARQDCQRAMNNGRHSSYGMYCDVPTGNGGYGNGGYGNGGYGNGGYGNGGYGNGGYGQTTTCMATLEDNWGRRIQSFYGRAGGYGDVRREACRDALRECNRFKTQRGYYNARCTSQSNW